MVLPALIIGLAISAAGCQNKPTAAPPAAPTLVEADLPTGTKIQGMLAKQLESGVDDEGSVVPMIVAADVKDSAGHVLIPKGTPMQGHVTWSRREGTLGSLVNRPARLKFAFDTTVAADGQPVDICADPNKVDEPFELNRGNTGIAGAAVELDSVPLDSRDETTLTAMTQLFENGDARDLESAEGRARLQALAEKLRLPGLQNLAQQNDVGKVRGLLDQLRKGNSLARLAPAAMDGPMTMAAVMEMSQLAQKVNDRLNKASHGRNIKAYIGTPVVAYVKAPLKVKVQS
ncbi:hypothetical protein [Fimbriimonas ginsengisoli]|uniref:Uncharacterized protein n=1 Tax=Fimbriimonas ginsengisoli Gsoil 348 TaxID=661478 RepID=A0A068NRM0_FIMGI|nr:hypothetical protein [Fimbriimonas ginsengisoli]AIE86188.1 hypothetical protein OP10G_2820 [Fimbriimonas ginsengisoli Gsoil 348]